MLRPIPLVSLIGLASLGSWWLVCSAAEPAKPPAPPDLLVLRSGEIITGQIDREGDLLHVTLPDGELRIHTRDVDLVCHSLDEAYSLKKSRLAPERADDHLDLAEWCLRQKLPGNAAKEIAAALALDPKNPRVDFLDRRLQQYLATPPAVTVEKASTDTHRVTNEDLERLVRGLPPNSVELFTANIQPLLINSCATSGCHGPGSKSTYVIIRIPNDRTGSRRLTQRNLQSTVQMLDYQAPQQSKLLTAASRAHGTATSAIFDPQTVKYRQLLSWIALVTERVPGAPDIPEAPATIGITGQASDLDSNLSHTLNSPSSDEESRQSKRNSHASSSGPLGATSDSPSGPKAEQLPATDGAPTQNVAPSDSAANPPAHARMSFGAGAGSLALGSAPLNAEFLHPAGGNPAADLSLASTVAPGQSWQSPSGPTGTNLTSALSMAPTNPQLMAITVDPFVRNAAAENSTAGNPPGMISLAMNSPAMNPTTANPAALHASIATPPGPNRAQMPSKSSSVEPPTDPSAADQYMQNPFLRNQFRLLPGGAAAREANAAAGQSSNPTQGAAAKSSATKSSAAPTAAMPADPFVLPVSTPAAAMLSARSANNGHPPTAAPTVDPPLAAGSALPK